MSLLDLPEDLTRHIAGWLSQTSLLNLAHTSRAMYTAIVPELYRHVLIDSSKRVFDEEQDAIYGGSGRQPVVIRSLFALTRFFKTLVLHPEFGRHLQRLHARTDFPDMPQCELSRFLEIIFPSLTNLLMLEWYAKECLLDAALLPLLPAFYRLQTLCGNLFISENFLKFPASSRLRELDVSNFTSHKMLAKIDLEQYPELRSLKIARAMFKVNQSAVVLAKHFNSLDNKAPASHLLPLFASVKHQIHLKSLTLSDIPLKLGDANILINSVNLCGLELFSLVNCLEWFPTEISHPGTVTIRRRTLPSQTFFKILEPYFNNLKLLHYDVCNNVCEDASVFSSLARFTNLKELGVCMHSFRRNGAIDLTPYINKLQPLAAKLERLEISFLFSGSPYGPMCPATSQTAHLKSLVALSNFKALKVLGIPVIMKQLPDLAETWTDSALEVLRLAVTDQLERPSACNDCSLRPVYDVYNSACLVSQEFFTCPTSFSSIVVDSNEQRYWNHALQCREKLLRLQYVRFDFKLLSLLFSCRTPDHIELKDGSFLNHYETLMHGIINR